MGDETTPTDIIANIPFRPAGAFRTTAPEKMKALSSQASATTIHTRTDQMSTMNSAAADESDEEVSFGSLAHDVFDSDSEEDGSKSESKDFDSHSDDSGSQQKRIPRSTSPMQIDKEESSSQNTDMEESTPARNTATTTEDQTNQQDQNDPRTQVQEKNLQDPPTLLRKKGYTTSLLSAPLTAPNPPDHPTAEIPILLSSLDDRLTQWENKLYSYPPDPTTEDPSLTLMADQFQKFQEARKASTMATEEYPHDIQVQFSVMVHLLKNIHDMEGFQELTPQDLFHRAIQRGWNFARLLYDGMDILRRALGPPKLEFINNMSHAILWLSYVSPEDPELLAIQSAIDTSWIREDNRIRDKAYLARFIVDASRQLDKDPQSLFEMITEKQGCLDSLHLAKATLFKTIQAEIHPASPSRDRTPQQREATYRVHKGSTFGLISTTAIVNDWIQGDAWSCKDEKTKKGFKNYANKWTKRLLDNNVEVQMDPDQLLNFLYSCYEQQCTIERRTVSYKDFFKEPIKDVWDVSMWKRVHTHYYRMFHKPPRKKEESGDWVPEIVVPHFDEETPSYQIMAQKVKDYGLDTMERVRNPELLTTFFCDWMHWFQYTNEDMLGLMTAELHPNRPHRYQVIQQLQEELFEALEHSSKVDGSANSEEEESRAPSFHEGTESHCFQQDGQDAQKYDSTSHHPQSGGMQS